MSGSWFVARGTIEGHGGLKGTSQFLSIGEFCAAANCTVSFWVTARVLRCGSGILNMDVLEATPVEMEA